MKTIKTILLGLVLLLGVKVSAQEKPFTFGVKAGANMSTVTGDIEDTKVRFGYNVGVTVDYAFTENWFILSGLEYTTKGVNGKKVLGMKPTLNAAYIQLPIHAGYKLNVSPSTKIVFHAGPYVALGVNGKIKIKNINFDVLEDFLDEDEIEVIEAINNSNINTFGNLMNRFDFGIGLGIGAEFGKINAGIGYDFGLLNVAKNIGGNDLTLRNGNAYISVGYKF